MFLLFNLDLFRLENATGNKTWKHNFYTYPVLKNDEPKFHFFQDFTGSQVPSLRNKKHTGELLLCIDAIIGSACFSQ